MKFDPVGKETEILNLIARKGPLKMRDLRKKWSSRTVYKQIPRLKTRGLIEETGDGWDATDLGFYHLVERRLGSSVAESKAIMKLARDKFPKGHTEKVYHWVHDAKPATLKDKLDTFLSWRQKAEKALRNPGKLPHHIYRMEIITDGKGGVGLECDSGWNLEELRRRPEENARLFKAFDKKS